METCATLESSGSMQKAYLDCIQPQCFDPEQSIPPVFRVNSLIMNAARY